jgi:hypothetical protein
MMANTAGPYYAVIFTSLNSAEDAYAPEMSDGMVQLALWCRKEWYNCDFNKKE